MSFFKCKRVFFKEIRVDDWRYFAWLDVCVVGGGGGFRDIVVGRDSSNGMCISNFQILICLFYLNLCFF